MLSFGRSVEKRSSFHSNVLFNYRAMYGTLSGRYDGGPKNGVFFNIPSILIGRIFSDPMPAAILPPPL